MVRSFGATAVFDYASPSVGSDIRVYTDGRLRYVLNCITDQASAGYSYSCTGTYRGTAGKYRLKGLNNEAFQAYCLRPLKPICHGRRRPEPQASGSNTYNAMGRTGCSYTSLEVFPAEWRPRDGVKYDFFLALEGFGKDLKLSGEYTRSSFTEKKALANIILFSE
ncbi:Enoyl reductase protein [Rutstroemia sp. NJR-2017a BBW]|nr:Enoyl reductase protein [Rutstroemia sp. NJR-2017a BBW]